MVAALVFSMLAADPAARLDAFLKAHPTFVAATEVSIGGKTAGRSTLRVQRPGRLRFDVQSGGFDYTLSGTERGYVEIDRVEKAYDERPSTGSLQLYDSRISEAGALLIPTYLLAGSTSAIFQGQKPKAVGDELRATYQTQSGEVELRLAIDPQGQPIRYTQIEGGRSKVWRTVSFAAGSTDLAAYRIEAPLGYVPHALPELPAPLPIGSPAPLKGWQRMGKSLDLGEAQPGRPRLLAVLGGDTASRNAKPFLVDLGKSMPVYLIGPGEISDPTGAPTKRLSPPGTPMFYLVGGDGKVKRLWLGFEKAGGAAWENEVRKVAAE